MLRSEPVAEANAQLLWALYSTDSSSQVRTEQPRVSGLVREATNCRKPPVDRTRRKLARFEVNSITGYYCLIERKPRFGAIPGDELLYCVSIPSLGLFEGRLFRTADLA